MGVIIRMDSTNAILSRRRMQPGGEAQIKFTKECAKAFNNYAPFKTGLLKDISIEIGVDFIRYDVPYARKQFYTNAGKGRQGTARGGLRGKHWDKRAWNDKGHEILQTIANFCGGRTE